MKYKLLSAGHVLRDDGACVPPDQRNRDYREYLAWVAQGNVPDPAGPQTQAEIDAAAKIAQNTADIAAARLYAKLTALSGLTPAQVQAWMAANVQTPGQIQDVTTTLAIATGVLWRDKQ